MRARLCLFCLIVTTGCRRDNPAFDESTGTDVTSSEGDPTTLTSVDAESDSGQEAPDPVCELEPGGPLEIDFGPPTCAETPESYDRMHPLLSIDGSTLNVGTCDQGALDCSECETAVEIPLNFAPLDLSMLSAVPGDCLRVQARRLDPSNPDTCRFQSVLIEVHAALARRPIMLARNTTGVALPMQDNSSPLASFDPTLVQVEDCACAEFPDECCDGVARTLYALDIGLPDPVQIGQTVPLEFPNDHYSFTTLDAFQTGECGEPRQEAWGLVGD
jgi:hypothetical protein